MLTLVDCLSRYGISRKLVNAKSDTVQEVLLDITKEVPEDFDSITFDNEKNGSSLFDVGVKEKT